MDGSSSSSFDTVLARLEASTRELRAIGSPGMATASLLSRIERIEARLAVLELRPTHDLHPELQDALVRLGRRVAAQ